MSFAKIDCGIYSCNVFVFNVATETFTVYIKLVVVYNCYAAIFTGKRMKGVGICGICSCPMYVVFVAAFTFSCFVCFVFFCNKFTAKFAEI